MDKYVNCNSIVEKLKTDFPFLFYDDKGRYTYTGLNILESIHNVPAAPDAVEVVRCQNCRYYDPSNLWCFKFLAYVTAEDYCSQARILE